MPLTLIFRASDSSTPREVTFDAPRVVLGRAEGSDLCLPDATVSHRHATIRQRGRDHIVMDEGSTNGTFVGPVKLSPGAPRVLTSGDRIRMGRIWVEAKITVNPPSPQGAVATREIALALVAEVLAAQGEASAPLVTVISGADTGKTLAIQEFQRPHIVGRLATADLVLEDTDASRRHVSIQRKGDQLWVQDLESKNGTLLGGEPVPASKDTVWPPGIALTIGSDVFTFSDPVREALRELEHIPDEPFEGETPLAQSGKSAIPSGLKPIQSKRPSPRSISAGGWGPSDWLVALLAVVVLAVSGLGLYWLLGSR